MRDIFFSRRVVFSCACAAGLLSFATPEAQAQEAPNTPAATQPAAGHVTIREQFRYIRFGGDPVGDRHIDEHIWWNSITLGITGAVSVSFEAPVVYRETEQRDVGENDSHFGLADMSLMLKWRFHQKDFGPIDTLRLALLAGAELPSGDDEYSSESVDPEVGFIATYIRGRHGVGATLRYRFTTGAHDSPVGPGESLADLVRYNASYLYRLAPAKYEADTAGSLYGAVELLGFAETNGDNEIFLAPGLMYEARSWAAEFSLAIPVWQDLSHRPEADFMLMFGIRLLF